MEKKKGRMVTHAQTVQQKRGVGQFIVQGLHVVQDCPYPLPILSIHGETTEDIAMQVDMGMEMVAALRGVTVEEIYKLVDTTSQMVQSTIKDLLSFWLKCITLLDNSFVEHTLPWASVQR